MSELQGGHNSNAEAQHSVGAQARERESVCLTRQQEDDSLPVVHWFKSR